MPDPVTRLNAALEGRYRIERQLGEGGMATVYLADDLRHERKVALKVLKPELAAVVGADRFLAEIKTTANLQHPHILPLFDSGRADSFLFYVMPHVEGESLRERLDREHQLPVDEAVQIAKNVAEALDYAHSQGVIHRDIKPANILLQAGKPVVADFGIALAVNAGGGGRLTETGLSLGTPHYMSPEQAAGDVEVDRRSDVYSLACVLYEMLIGRPPHQGSTAQAVLAKVLTEMPVAPRALRTSVPRHVDALVRRALERRPQDRLSSAAEFSRLAADGTFRYTGRSDSDTSRFRVGASKVVGLALVALLVGGAGIAAWTLLASRARPPTAGAFDLEPGRVAVLYFEDDSPAGGLDHVADGITDDLISQLGQAASVTVVSRNGAHLYRDLSRPDSVARELEVGTLIVGSLDQDENDLRVSVALVDGETGLERDRTTVEVPAGNFLSGRDAVATEVFEMLGRRLGEDVDPLPPRDPTSNEDAWAQLQRAERFRTASEENFERGGEIEASIEALRQAELLLTVAERADPAWIRPLATKANVRYRLAWFALAGGNPEASRDHLSLGLEYAQEALARDPAHGFSLEQRGTLKMLSAQVAIMSEEDYERLVDEATADLQRATEFDPSRATAYAMLSFLMEGDGQPAEADSAAVRALELDPYVPGSDRVNDRVFTARYDQGRFREARGPCEVGARRYRANWRFVECKLWLMAAPTTSHDVGAAVELLASLDSLLPTSIREYRHSIGQIMVAGVLMKAGLEDYAATELARVEHDPEIDPQGQLFLYKAAILANTGTPDLDGAMEALRAWAAVSGDELLNPDGEQLHWWWHGLRDRPEFQQFVAEGR